jgi:DNA-binding HxlR family transcriptional regulator
MDQNHPDSSGHIDHTADQDDGSVLQPCLAEDVLKLLIGKWKPQILQLASQKNVRFNSLLRKIPGSNKQGLSVALRELEDAKVLQKHTVSSKPLHIEYILTDYGRSMLPIFIVASNVAKGKTEQ